MYVFNSTTYVELLLISNQITLNWLQYKYNTIQIFYSSLTHKKLNTYIQNFHKWEALL